MRTTKPKEINFYIRYISDPVAEAKKRELLKALLPIGAVLAVIFLVFLVFGAMIAFKSIQINSMQDYTSDPVNIRDYNRATVVIEKRDALAGQYNELTKIKQAVRALPELTSGLMYETAGCLGNGLLQKCSFDVDSGKLVLDVQTRSVTNIPDMVKKLKRSGNFKSVKYRGYDSSDKRYHATITCVVKSGR